MQNTVVINFQHLITNQIYINHEYVAYQPGYGVWRTRKPEQTFEDTYYATDVDDMDDCDDKNCKFSKLSGTAITSRHIKTCSRQFNRKKSFKNWTV
jgi:hypothetical protein